MYCVERARASLNEALKPERAAGHHIPFYLIAVTGSCNNAFKNVDEVSHIENGDIVIRAQFEDARDFNDKGNVFVKDGTQWRLLELLRNNYK